MVTKEDSSKSLIFLILYVKLSETQNGDGVGVICSQGNVTLVRLLRLENIQQWNYICWNWNLYHVSVAGR